MATAEQLREEFVRGLERMQMDYAILDESDNFMSVSLVLSKVAVTVYVEFDKNGDNANVAHFYAPWIAKFEEKDLSEIYTAINALNRRFPFVKWTIDEDICYVSCKADDFVFGGAEAACMCQLGAIFQIAEEGVVSLGDLVTPRMGDNRDSVIQELYNATHLHCTDG